MRGRRPFSISFHSGRSFRHKPPWAVMWKKFNIKFQVWDLGGQESLRPYWSTYYQNTHAVIMVVDSSDRERVAVTKEELFRMLSVEEVKDAVVLVFANKQDVAGAMTVAEIADALELDTVKSHQWHIQGCCAISGQGLYEG